MARFQIDELIGDGASGAMFEVTEAYPGAFQEYGIPPVELAEAMMTFLRPYMRRRGRHDGCCYACYDGEAVGLNRRLGGNQSYPEKDEAFGTD